MSNSTRIAERQPTDTSSPMPVDVARDLLATVRALEARVAVLENLLASAITPPSAPVPHYIPGLGMVLNGHLMGHSETDPGFQAGAVAGGISDALSAALRLPTVPDAYGR